MAHSPAMSATDEGSVNRAHDARVNINDKQIIVGLQAGNMHCGIIEAFQADRGGMAHGAMVCFVSVLYRTSGVLSPEKSLDVVCRLE